MLRPAHTAAAKTFAERGDILRRAEYCHSPQRQRKCSIRALGRNGEDSPGVAGVGRQAGVTRIFVVILHAQQARFPGALRMELRAARPLLAAMLTHKQKCNQQRCGQQQQRAAREKRRQLTRPRVRCAGSVSRNVRHVCSTPGLNFGTSGFSAQASSASSRTSRVFAGSMMASIHSRAAP